MKNIKRYKKLFLIVLSLLAVMSFIVAIVFFSNSINAEMPDFNTYDAYEDYKMIQLSLAIVLAVIAGSCGTGIAVVLKETKEK